MSMQIFVGNNVYDVEASTTVEALMYQIENKEFIPVGSFALIGSAGTPLETEDLLGDEEELELTLAVPAGMRKKWKKKRMRRLRRKRRKMRQRAR
jgi:ubiquitin-small subunit ribosomal protein S27Ae